MMILGLFLNYLRLLKLNKKIFQYEFEFATKLMCRKRNKIILMVNVQIG
jgi:hypothetical protein